MNSAFPLMMLITELYPTLCFLLHNQVGMSSVFPFVMGTNSVLSVTHPGWDEFSLSICDVNLFSAFCYTARLGWVKSFLLWCERTLCFVLHNQVGMRSVFPFLWCEPIQCLLLHNQIGMGSVFPFVKRTNSVLSVTQPGWDELSLSFCAVNKFSAFC